jgi:hypothetical protein
VYQQFLIKAQEDIATVRSIIKTNENLRNLILTSGTQQQAKEYVKIIEILKEDIPTTKNWRIYEHCSVVTKLYAIYENFVEDLIRDWLRVLPKLFLCYSELDERLKDTHQAGIGRLLIERKKNRYKHLPVEEVVKSLFAVINNEEEYVLFAEAFLFHEQNLRKEILEKLLADTCISNTWSWICNHRSIQEFTQEVNQTRVEGELNKLINYRNEAAHGSLIDNVLSFKELLELCDFVESLCQALTELVLYKTIQCKENIGQAKKIGKITEWFNRPQAGVAKVEKITLSVGCSLFLISENFSYCRSAFVESIQIDDQPVSQIQATTEIEVGLKFDVDARQGLYLYIIE